ncbi:glycosyltransferase [Lactobacillus helveticus]|uniref:glycosyltransferase n=1 Tax=Lactobacillus helveticus TaxID=1587 RepID=UPI0035CC55D2
MVTTFYQTGPNGLFIFYQVFNLILQSAEFKYIINPNNMGIQQSRVNGLRISTGDYIIFLDQDDQLVTQNYISQVENMEYADVVVGNLYKDVDGKKKLL